MFRRPKHSRTMVPLAWGRGVVEQYRKREWTDPSSGGPGAELIALLRSLGEE